MRYNGIPENYVLLDSSVMTNHGCLDNVCTTAYKKMQSYTHLSEQYFKNFRVLVYNTEN